MRQEFLDRQADLGRDAVAQRAVPVGHCDLNAEGARHRIACACDKGDLPGDTLPRQQRTIAGRACAHAAHIALCDLPDKHHRVGIHNGHAGAAGLQQITDLDGARFDDARERGAYLCTCEIELALREIGARCRQACFGAGDRSFALQASFTQAPGAVEFDASLIDGLPGLL